jgi:hypothetical protein
MGAHIKLIAGGAAILLATGGASQAAPTGPHLIHVGDGTITGAKLKPYNNAWMFSFVKDGQRKDQGIWSDVLRFREVDGKRVAERIQGMTYPNGLSSVTINRFDPATLAPVYSEQHTPDGKLVKRTFAGSHVELHLTKGPGDAETVTQTDLPAAAYDFNGGMYGILIAAQPLRIGYSGRIPAVEEFDNGFVAVPFHVVRRETIRAGFKGRTNAWVVDVGGEAPMTFWISNDAPYILRLSVPMNGGAALYDIIG